MLLALQLFNNNNNRREREQLYSNSQVRNMRLHCFPKACTPFIKVLTAPIVITGYIQMNPEQSKCLQHFFHAVPLHAKCTMNTFLRHVKHSAINYSLILQKEAFSF